jgi:hypothetical protein
MPDDDAPLLRFNPKYSWVSRDADVGSFSASLMKARIVKACGRAGIGF